MLTPKQVERKENLARAQCSVSVVPPDKKKENKEDTKQ